MKRNLCLKKKKEKREGRSVRSSHSYTCLIVILSTEMEKKKITSKSSGIFWIKIWLLFFLRTYSPLLRGSMAKVSKRKVDVHQLYKFNEVNCWMFSTCYRKHVMEDNMLFWCLSAIVSLAGRQLQISCYLGWGFFSSDNLIVHGIDLAPVIRMWEKQG